MTSLACPIRWVRARRRRAVWNEAIHRQPRPFAAPLTGCSTLVRELAPGLVLRRITCPIGVLCIIFEARPEAVVQIASLALKSGNAVILKGGKEAVHSNAALVEVIRQALSTPALRHGHDAGVPVDAVQLVSTRDEVADLLRLDSYIDVRRAIGVGDARASHLSSARCCPLWLVSDVGPTSDTRCALPAAAVR